MDAPVNYFCPHGCGVCDGPLVLDTIHNGYPSWRCANCDAWHISKDCCYQIPYSTVAQCDHENGPCSRCCPCMECGAIRLEDKQNSSDYVWVTAIRNDYYGTELFVNHTEKGAIDVLYDWVKAHWPLLGKNFDSITNYSKIDAIATYFDYLHIDSYTQHQVSIKI